MDRAGHELLARARLAAEQHGHVARGDTTDGLVDLLHAWMPADDRTELPDFLQAALEPRDFLGQPARREGPVGEQQHPVEIERLREIVVGAALHRLDRSVHGAVGRHHDHAGVGADLAQATEQAEAVDARHPHVEEDQIERLGLEDLERGAPVLDGGHVVAGLTKALLEDPAQAVLVVGDQDPGHHFAVGRKHVTLVPRPGALSTWIAPRCSSRMRWQIESPRPSPLSLVVKKGSKIRARMASGMPEPSSVTCASTILRWPAPRSILPNRGFRLTRVVRVRRPPRSIASSPLRRGLCKTGSRRSSSPRIGGRLGSYRRIRVTDRSRALSSFSNVTRSRSWWRFSGTARSWIGRARSSSDSMIRFTRSTSVKSTSVYSARRESGPISRRSSCTAPRMAPSGLRTSWASPTAMRPAAARVSPRRTSASSWWIRERSRSTTTAASTCPSRPQSGAVTTETGTPRPSTRSTTPSASDRLSPVARVSPSRRTTEASGEKPPLT